MSEVTTELLVPSVQATDVYPVLGDFARYAQLTETVEQVTVEKLDGNVCRSSWDVRFRKGLLRWTEIDRFEPDAGLISFEQERGDFESFAGTWLVEDAGPGARVRFDAHFDLGMPPSLAEFIDPVAETTLLDNIAAIVRALFGEQVQLLERRVEERAQ